MQNWYWQKNRNFREQENADGTVVFIITVDGEDVPVSEEIYREYASGAWKMENMERKLKRNRFAQDEYGRAIRDVNGQPVLLPEREVSLEGLMSKDVNFITEPMLPEDNVLSQMEYDELHASLSIIATEDRELIYALYFSNDGKGMTERDYALISGIPQKTINDRKLRVLARLKKILSK